ncbi:MAG: CopG family transcriptional regulator [Oceanipulchritudo sp.]
MRTTILLDDKLAEQLRAKARSKGLSLSAFLAEAGRAALKADKPTRAQTFKLVCHGKSGPFPGINLDRTSELLAAEDEGTYRA